MCKFNFFTAFIITRNNIKCKDCDSILSNYTEYRAHVKAHESGEIPVKSTYDTNDHVQPNNVPKNEVFLSHGLDISQNGNSKIEVYKITSILSEEHRSELDEVGNTTETTEMIIEINAAATPDTLKFSCVICQKAFDDQQHLDEHKKVHGTELHLCQVCDTTFDSSALLDEHLKTNHKSTISCKKCDQVLDNIVEFKAHMKAIHKVSRPKKEYPCELCGKILRSIESLKIHLENHDRDLTCTECGLKVIITLVSYFLVNSFIIKALCFGIRTLINHNVNCQVSSITIYIYCLITYSE